MFQKHFKTNFKMGCKILQKDLKYLLGFFLNMIKRTLNKLPTKKIEPVWNFHTKLKIIIGIVLIQINDPIHI